MQHAGWTLAMVGGRAFQQVSNSWYHRRCSLRLPGTVKLGQAAPRQCYVYQTVSPSVCTRRLRIHSKLVLDTHSQFALIPFSSLVEARQPFYNVKHLLFNARTSYGHRCIKYKGSSLWNSLPMPLRLCSSIAVFKRHVENYLRTLWDSKC